MAAGGFLHGNHPWGSQRDILCVPLLVTVDIMLRLCGWKRSRRNTVRLSLDTREVGRVTIVHCNGRIVAGIESESLRSHFAWLLRDRRSIVLHLGEVAFIDSSGLGTLVRTLTSARQARAVLKLCNVPPPLLKLLALSHLTSLFVSHESEEAAIASFYRPGARVEEPPSAGRSVLCLDSNSDVLAYLRETLRRAGYEVHTSSHLRDALVLMRVTRFDLVVTGSDIAASPDAYKSFQSACASLPVIELGSDFSTRDASEAYEVLLGKIEAHLPRKHQA
jgi:anti-sigma B factor antagonist